LNSAACPTPISCACFERREQSGGVAVAAGAGVVLRVGEHHGRSDVAALRGARDRLVGRVQLHRELGFGVVDRVGERVDRTLHARRVWPVPKHRHLALGEIRHREAGREREHRVVLALERFEELVQPFAGLDERRLRRQSGEEIERPHRARERMSRVEHSRE
jgi:hypothetical protein